MEEFVSESAIMLDFDHPNVLKLLGVCFDTEDHLPLIVLPFMANGDLKSFLIRKRGDEDVNVLPEVRLRSLQLHCTFIKTVTILYSFLFFFIRI